MVEMWDNNFMPFKKKKELIRMVKELGMMHILYHIVKNREERIIRPGDCKAFNAISQHWWKHPKSIYQDVLEDLGRNEFDFFYFLSLWEMGYKAYMKDKHKQESNS